MIALNNTKVTLNDAIIDPEVQLRDQQSVAHIAGELQKLGYKATKETIQTDLYQYDRMRAMHAALAIIRGEDAINGPLKDYTPKQLEHALNAYGLSPDTLGLVHSREKGWKWKDDYDSEKRDKDHAAQTLKYQSAGSFMAEQLFHQGAQYKLQNTSKDKFPEIKNIKGAGIDHFNALVDLQRTRQLGTAMPATSTDLLKKIGITFDKKGDVAEASLEKTHAILEAGFLYAGKTPGGAVIDPVLVASGLRHTQEQEKKLAAVMPLDGHLSPLHEPLMKMVTFQKTTKVALPKAGAQGPEIVVLTSAEIKNLSVTPSKEHAGDYSINLNGETREVKKDALLMNLETGHAVKLAEYVARMQAQWPQPLQSLSTPDKPDVRKMSPQVAAHMPKNTRNV